MGLALLFCLASCGGTGEAGRQGVDATADGADVAVTSDAAAGFDPAMDAGDAANLVPPDNAERAFGARTWVRYQVQWRFDDALRDADGAAHFTSSEGLAISVDALMVVQGAMSMVPCATQASFVERGVDALKWMFGAPTVAFANHGYDADSTFVSELRVWDGLSEEWQTYAEAPVLDAATYCGIYHRFEPVDSARDAAIAYQSLWARGSYAQPGEVPTPFDVTVNLPQGAQHPFVVGDEPSAFTGGTDVRVSFHAARMFDGLTPSMLTDRELAYGLLRNLAQAATIEVHAPAP